MLLDAIRRHKKQTNEFRRLQVDICLCAFSCRVFVCKKKNKKHEIGLMTSITLLLKIIQKMQSRNRKTATETGIPKKYPTKMD